MEGTNQEKGSSSSLIRGQGEMTSKNKSDLELHSSQQKVRWLTRFLLDTKDTKITFQFLGVLVSLC